MIAIQNIGGASLYLLQDDADYELTADNLKLPDGTTAFDVNTSNSDVETGVAPPDLFVGAAMRWTDGGWLITDQALYDAGSPEAKTLKAAALAAAKVQRHDDVDDLLAQKMALGFPWDFGTAEAPNPQTLQCAGSEDRTNWLTLMFGCMSAMSAGQGAAPVSPPLRCTSNAEFTPTIAETVTILQAMTIWGADKLAASWGVKNAIDALTDPIAVLSYDITQGWPI